MAVLIPSIAVGALFQQRHILCLTVGEHRIAPRLRIKLTERQVAGLAETGNPAQVVAVAAGAILVLNAHIHEVARVRRKRRIHGVRIGAPGGDDRQIRAVRRGHINLSEDRIRVVTTVRG